MTRAEMAQEMRAEIFTELEADEMFGVVLETLEPEIRKRLEATVEQAVLDFLAAQEIGE